MIITSSWLDPAASFWKSIHVMLRLTFFYLKFLITAFSMKTCSYMPWDLLLQPFCSYFNKVCCFKCSYILSATGTVSSFHIRSRHAIGSNSTAIFPLHGSLWINITQLSLINDRIFLIKMQWLSSLAFNYMNTFEFL